MPRRRQRLEFNPDSLRAARGLLTLHEAAADFGICNSYLYFIERGLRRPSLALFLPIVHCYGPERLANFIAALS